VDEAELTSIPVDFAVLRKWMDERGLGSGPIEEVARLAGGTQNILLRFRRGDSSYALRRPAAHPRKYSNETIRREALLLSRLANTTIPHPRLISACPDESVLGAAFYLMEVVDGFNATAGLPSLHADSQAIRYQMGLKLVEGIAALSKLDYQALGLQGFGKPEGFLRRQVNRWIGQLESYYQYSGWNESVLVNDACAIVAWLDARRPGTFQPGIMHGDYHLANVMYRYEGPDLAAILDWELATIGAPLLDLAWLVTTWPDADHFRAETVLPRPCQDFPGWRELVSHYEKCTNCDLSSFEWYAVLACYKRSVLLEETYARACAGLVPRQVGEQFHAKSASLLLRAKEWMK
jgi:aminoglycoside phosphotransferase (APT) family kinase protein